MNYITIKGITFRFWLNDNLLFVTDDEHEIISYDLNKWKFSKALGKSIAYLMYWYVQKGA